MNQRQRKAQLARAHDHQAWARQRRQAQRERIGMVITMAGRPPDKPRKRPIPKKKLRSIGVKVRESVPFWLKHDREAES